MKTKVSLLSPLLLLLHSGVCADALPFPQKEEVHLEEFPLSSFNPSPLHSPSKEVPEKQLPEKKSKSSESGDKNYQLFHEVLIPKALVQEEVQTELKTTPDFHLETKSLPILPEENLKSTPGFPELLFPQEGHTINFSDVPIEEFIRFVSKISEVNFIFDNKNLDFSISLTSGKSVSAENVLGALIRILRLHGFWVNKEEGYFVVHKIDPLNPPPPEWDALIQDKGKEVVQEQKPQPIEALVQEMLPGIKKEEEPFEFFVYKLKYHEGSEIQDALKQAALDLKMQPDTPQKFLSAVQTVQWVRATNSLLCSGNKETIEALNKLLDTLDTALRQVFIEVLVIETDVNNGLDFGLQWAASGQLKNDLGAGAGGFPPGGNQAPFSKTMQGINVTNIPTGLGQFPVGNGFDLGIIGDIIFHKGKSFLSLGSLVSALQTDGGSTIVLNQKIIAQDNKPSRIFVGDNIPFTGSVVQMVGQNQQTTSNIEYRDIGVNLNIKPMIGNDEVVTLDLEEEISETVNQPNMQMNQNQASGIRTTKTNMVTHVHVPNKHFLILSGMIRNAKSDYKAGLPCLGGLPFIGSLFSKKTSQDEKRNIIIFVRPQIIHTVEDYKKISGAQRELHRGQSPQPESFDDGMRLVPHMLND